MSVARYNASNAKIAYTRGDFENEPAEPAKDAITTSSYYQSAMVKLLHDVRIGRNERRFGQSLRVLILNNTKFKAMPALGPITPCPDTL